MYHLTASFVAVLGVLTSFYALLGERFKWASFGSFSVATKVPVEVFCVEGPIVMVTFVLYALLAFLLATERATSTCFYISASWAIIFMDMCIILHKDWRDIYKQNIDSMLHFVNAYISTFCLVNMQYLPTSFLLISLACWGALVMSRVIRRYLEKIRPRLPSRELERARNRQGEGHTQTQSQSGQNQTSRATQHSATGTNGVYMNGSRVSPRSTAR